MVAHVASSWDGSKNLADEELKRVTAFKAVFRGNSNREQGEIVLTHLCKHFGFFEPPTLEGWIKTHGSAVGYELSCAIHAARLEPIRNVLNHLDWDDGVMIQLEKAAQRERR